MFKRKNPESAARPGANAPRGRAAAGATPPGSSPLARRFLADGEPATVDLAEPGRFHVPPGGEDAEPGTRVTSDGAGPDGAVEIMDTLAVLDAASADPGCPPMCECE